MLRYLAPATAIVLGAILILLVLPRPTNHAPHGPQYGGPRASPRPGAGDARGRGPAESIRASAPWALSVVPDCFRQTASYRGTVAFARAHVPRGAVRLAAGVRLRAADCVLDVGRDSATLARGDDRFTIPPHARFYRSGRALVLDQSDGTREEVRLYRVYSP